MNPVKTPLKFYIFCTQPPFFGTRHAKPNLIFPGCFDLYTVPGKWQVLKKF